MVFNTPTTKEEMYATLKELFHYYRIRREIPEEIDLKPLELQRIEFTPLTDLQLQDKAHSLVLPEVERDCFSVTEKLKQTISNLNKEKISLEQAKEKALLEVEKSYYAQEQKILEQAQKRGIDNSNIVINEISKIQDLKNQELAKTTTNYDQKIVSIDGEIESLEQDILSAENFFSSLLEKKVMAMVLKLKEEQQKEQNEVFKYNNGLDEKEQRHLNSITRQKADLIVKIKQINADFLTKDQLVEMGYYADVVSCVCGYYDTLDAVEAYQDMSSEPNLSLYLDDYYGHILLLYRNRTGL
jgi:hypothetical protein